MSVNDRQEGGGHYKPGASLQHWDWVVECRLDYLTGHASKYICRNGRKAGEDPTLGLRKAIHFLDKAIEVCGAKQSSMWLRPRLPDRSLLHQYTRSLVDSLDLSQQQHDILQAIAVWSVPADLEIAKRRIQIMIDHLPVPIEDSNRHADRTP